VWRRALIVAVAALVWAPGALGGSFTKTDATLTASDGVPLAYSLYVPDGTGPFPAVMLFHGLGQNRSAEDGFASALASDGYVALAPDARGHGASGGTFSLDGPREIQDVRELFGVLAARPDVDPKAIGAFGVSLGGGLVWNATAAGVPFAAIEPDITWTDLASALAPESLPKTGAIFLFANSVAGKIDPSLAALLPDLLAGRNLPPILAALRSRSSRPALASLSVPTFMLQGRTDYAFDIDQALAAYRLLRGPKRLYIGDLGHAPAANPPAEVPYVQAEQIAWFDRYLKGTPNGIDRRPPVELAASPWNGRTASYAGIPRTTSSDVDFTVRRGTLGGSGKLVLTGPPMRAGAETFGAPVLRLSLAHSTFTHLVAVLCAGPTIVSEGGTALQPGAKSATIRMISTSVPIAKGARLTVTLAGASTAKSPSNLLYPNVEPATARLTVSSAALSMPLLQKRVSP
jgi:alpha-beta hydrolase superfamily lysophospholipase